MSDIMKGASQPSQLGRAAQMTGVWPANGLGYVI